MVKDEKVFNLFYHYCISQMLSDRHGRLVEMLSHLKISTFCKSYIILHYFCSREYYEQGPGVAVIVNQKEFESREIQTREGTDIDRDELEATFSYLGVRPEDMFIYDNLSDTEMREKLETAARAADNNPECAWVAVIILSHGRIRNKEDEVLGVNGEGVVVDEVSNCKI